ncbi:MAG: 6-phosphogluconolactonase [Anaerolineales bacterium]|nr:6-phosphogluconolactonase [Anaerolineales bacterium]
MIRATSNIRIFADRERLAQAAAGHIAGLANRATQARRRFSLALAGGSTPAETYRLLANAELDWEHIHVFWGDERCTPPDHPDSNYRMARLALLDHVPIPAQNVQRMRGEISPKQAAAEYEQILRDFFALAGGARRSTPSNPQTFDLVLLGMGADGHTASLFPAAPALEEKERWVVAVPHESPPAPLVTRLSLTLPAINAAAQVVFLVAGADKASRLQEALSPPCPSQPALPVQRVRPASGDLLWLIDHAAAGAER